MTERGRENTAISLDTQFFQAITRSDASLLRRSISEGMEDYVEDPSLDALANIYVGTPTMITDPAMIAQVHLELDESYAILKRTRRETIDSPALAPHMDALRQASDFLESHTSLEKSHIGERQPNLAEQEVIRQTTELQLNAYQPLINRWDNYYAFDRARREAQKPITDKISDNKAANLAKNLRTLAQELVFTHFRQTLMLGCEIVLTKTDDKKYRVTLTSDDLPSLSFRPITNKGDMSDFMYEVILNGEAVGEVPGSSIYSELGESVESLTAILQDEDHLQRGIALDQIFSIADFLFDGAELMDTVVAGEPPKRIYVTDFISNASFNNIDNTIRHKEECTVSHRELMAYAMLQIAKKRTALSVRELFSYEEKHERKNLPPLVIEPESVERLNILSNPENLLSTLSLETFSATGNIRSLTELVTYSGREKDLHVYRLPRLLFGADTTITSLRPTKITNLVINRKIFTVLPFALPEFSRITSLEVTSQNTDGPLISGDDYVLVRDEVYGTYIAILTPEGMAKINNSSGLLYTAAVKRYDEKYPAKEKPLAEIPVDIEKLRQFVQHITTASLRVVTQEVKKLLTSKQPVTLQQVIDAVAATLRYSILPRQVKAKPRDPVAKEIIQTILGIDSQTGYLKVQCAHASALAKIVIKHVVPDTVLEQATIGSESVVRKKMTDGKRVIFGSLHTYTQMHLEDGIATIDLTPQEDYEAFQRELSEWNKEMRSSKIAKQITPEVHQAQVDSIARDLGNVLPYTAQILPHASELLENVHLLPMATHIALSISYVMQGNEIPTRLKDALEEIIQTSTELKSLPKELKEERIGLLEEQEKKMLGRYSLPNAFARTDYFYTMVSLAYRLLEL